MNYARNNTTGFNFKRLDKDKLFFRINNQIRVREVRLVGDNIENPGVVPTHKALKLADEMESSEDKDDVYRGEFNKATLSYRKKPYG